MTMLMLVDVLSSFPTYSSDQIPATRTIPRYSIDDVNSSDIYERNDSITIANYAKYMESSMSVMTTFVEANNLSNSLDNDPSAFYTMQSSYPANQIMSSQSDQSSTMTMGPNDAANEKNDNIGAPGGIFSPAISLDAFTSDAVENFSQPFKWLFKAS